MTPLLWSSRLIPALRPAQTSTNVANVSSATDPDDENNGASAVTTVSGGMSADLAVTKTADSDQALSPSDVTYTIQVVDNGPDDASTVQLNDTLPDDMTFVAFQQDSGPGWSCSKPAVGSGGTVVCTIAALPVGTTSIFELKGHIPAGKPSGPFATPYLNQAFVTSSNDPNSENDRGEASTAVVAAAPTLTTQASRPGLARRIDLGYGDAQRRSFHATGAINFFAFGPNDSTCGGSLTFVSTANVAGDGQYHSAPLVPDAPGTYIFVASYSGDANNKATANACGDPNESVVVTAPTPTPSPTPTATATATPTATATATATPTATPAQSLNISTRLRVQTRR